MSSVYFAQAGRRIKIGVAKHPERRLRSIQTAQATKVRLLGAIPGSFPEEKALHRQLEPHHIRGEWFNDCKEVRAVIKHAMATAKPVKPQIDAIATFVNEINNTTKGVLQPGAFNVLTPEQLTAFKGLLLVRIETGIKLYEAAKTNVEVNSILTLSDDLLRGVFADCLFPTKGATDEDTKSYDAQLLKKIQSAAVTLAFQAKRASRALNE